MGEDRRAEEVRRHQLSPPAPTNGPAPGNRGRRGSAALAAAALLLCFGALELALRATFAGEVTAPCTVASADLVWARRPHCSETNGHGFRDRDYAFAKPPDVQRLVLIGDSVVEGAGVALAESFGERLEDGLNRRASRRFQVIQLAVGGYTLSQELVLLRTRAFAYDPDVILWSYVFNDPIDPRHHSIHFNPARLGARRAWSEPAVHALAFLSERWFLLRERLRARSCPQEYHHYYDCAYREKIARGIAEIAEVARAHEVPVLFVIQPIYHAGAFAQYGYRDLHDRIGALAASNGLAVVDMLDAVGSRDVREVGIVDADGRVDVWHPSPAGHQAIADHLLGALRRGGFAL